MIYEEPRMELVVLNAEDTIVTSPCIQDIGDFDFITESAC